MKFIELFGGVGGFRVGMERAGHECVWYNEWDKYSVSVYNHNFGEAYEPTDITKVDAKGIPDHDILTGGFPCQSWSVAGKREGFDDARGTMFFEIAKIVEAKKPKYLFLENVKGLLSHGKGKSFERICEIICDLGYAIDFAVLNSKFYGVPQNRERVFILAIRDDIYERERNNRSVEEKKKKCGMEMQRTLDGESTHKDVGQSIAGAGANPRLVGYISELVGHLREGRRPEVFPLGENAGKVQGVPGKEIKYLKKNTQCDSAVDPKGLYPTLSACTHGWANPSVGVEFDRNNGIGKKLETAHCLSASDWRGLNRNQRQTAVMVAQPKVYDSQHRKIREYENHSPTLCARMGTGGNNVPMVVGMLPITAKKRCHDTPKEINQFLKGSKGNYTIMQIAESLELPKTQVEHYFRTDMSRAVPSPQIWIKLKELLLFDATYDKQVTELYEKEVEYEMTRRVYDVNGQSPTLNTDTPMILSNPHGFNKGGLKDYPNVRESAINNEFIVAQRGRNPINPSDRTAGATLEQTFEPNVEGNINCLSTVSKDNLVAQQKILQRNQQGKIFQKDVVGTLHGSMGNNQSPFLMIRDGRDNRSCLRAGRVPELGVKGMSLRRLTPIECSLLQGFPSNWNEYGVKYLNTETYNKDHADAKKTNTIEILQKLQEAVSKSKGEGWRFAEHIPFLEKEVLQPKVHERELQTEVEGEYIGTSRKLQSKAVDSCNRMLELWKQEKSGYPSQRREQIEQLLTELDSALQKLPHESSSQHIVFERISDSQRYKQCGNAVTTNVIYAIARKIIS